MSRTTPIASAFNGNRRDLVCVRSLGLTLPVPAGYERIITGARLPDDLLWHTEINYIGCAPQPAGFRSSSAGGATVSWLYCVLRKIGAGGEDQNDTPA